MGFALGIDECNSTGKGTGVNLFLCVFGGWGVINFWHLQH